MKKNAVSIIFTLIIVCSLLLPAITGLANAAAAGYSHTTYFLANAVTLDGRWVGNEWDDTDITGFGSGSACFRTKWGANGDYTVITQYILVELLGDTTNDTADLLQFCFDGDISGGTAPQAGDIRIDITGNRAITAYNGNGASWAQVATPASFTWSGSISATPTSSTPHLVFEIIIDNIPFGIGANWWLRIAFSDASNTPAGTRACPPTSRDVPNDWGDIPYQTASTPEGVGLGSVVLLSSVAVAVGVLSLRKRKGKQNNLM